MVTYLRSSSTEKNTLQWNCTFLHIDWATLNQHSWHLIPIKCLYSHTKAENHPKAVPHLVLWLAFQLCCSQARRQRCSWNSSVVLRWNCVVYLSCVYSENCELTFELCLKFGKFWLCRMNRVSPSKVIAAFFCCCCSCASSKIMLAECIWIYLFFPQSWYLNFTITRWLMFFQTEHLHG